MMRKLLSSSDGKLLKNLHSSCGKNLMALETLQKRFDHTLYISSSKLFEKGLNRQDNIAIITNQHYTEKHHHQHDQHEEFVTTKHTYSDLIRDSSNFANKLVDQYCSESALFDKDKKVKLLTNEKICFLFDPGYDYTVTLWSIWRTNGTAVPLCNTHPTKELKYYIVDSQCKVVIYQKEKKSSLEPLFEEMKHIKFVEYDNSLTKPIDNSKLQLVDLNQNDKENGSLIVYTSGTTGNPKAVVLTFSNILTQANILCSEWEWSEKDQILHLLPLHHVHGLINALTCPLYCAATIEFLKFNPEQVWKKLTNSDKKPEEKKINVFMAVPTIYVKLIHYYDELPHKTQKHYTEQIEKLRLMVSGSSALPTSVYSKWKKISHHNLLERFGMSEIQMAISNPMNKENRKMGCVGFPLPTVEVKIVDFETREEITKPNEPGELLVKGPSVFKEYLGRPDATKKAFTQDGYFITGDSVLIDEDGYYKICGRLSSDIIKSGGYKISALDIERVILDMSKIKECAVLGVQDEEYGERVGAIISLHKGQTLTLKELQDFCSQELAKYKLPTRLVVLPEGEEIPKNAMGKVAKKSLVKFFSNL